MRCVVVNTKGRRAIICGRGRSRRPEPCFYCGGPSTSLCDHPVFRRNVKQTCDTPMCDGCKKSIGEDVDLCRSHSETWVKNGKKFVLGGAEI